jgi:hypothetical protein
MNRSFSYMAQCGLSALTLCALAPAGPASADTVIRIIGDRTPVAPNNSGGATAAEPPSSSSGENGIIRIIGARQSTVQKPASGQAAQPEPNQSTSTGNGTCINDDNMSEIQLTQRLDSLKAEVARKAAEKTEQNRLALGKDERENAAAMQSAIEQEQEQLTAGRAKKPRQGGKKTRRNRH